MPEVCCCSYPSNQRGAGKTGSRLAPAVRARKMHTGGPTGEPEASRSSLRGWCCGLLRVLPGETSSIATIALQIADASKTRSGRCTTTRFDASFGRQDRATSPTADALVELSAARCAHLSKPNEDALQRRSSCAPDHRSRNQLFKREPPCNTVSRLTLPRPPHPKPNVS